MWLIRLWTWVTGGRIAKLAIAALVGIGAYWGHNAIIRKDERNNVIDEQRAENNKAAQVGTSSAVASGKPGVSGVRSPRYRD